MNKEQSLVEVQVGSGLNSQNCKDLKGLAGMKPLP